MHGFTILLSKFGVAHVAVSKDRRCTRRENPWFRVVNRTRTTSKGLFT